MDSSPDRLFAHGISHTWSGLPFPSLSDLPGIDPNLLHWQARSLPLSHQGSPIAPWFMAIIASAIKGYGRVEIPTGFLQDLSYVSALKKTNRTQK